MILTDMEVYGMYLFEWYIMLILCVIVSQNSHYLLVYIARDGIYVNQSVNAALYQIQQLKNVFKIVIWVSCTVNFTFFTGLQLPFHNNKYM